MKRTILFLVLAVLTPQLVGKSKLHPSYDRVAVLTVEGGHYDYSASSYDSTTGQRYDTFCDTTETSISCSDSPGGGHYLIFADGTRARVQMFPNLSFWHRNDILYPDPLYGYYDDHGQYVSLLDHKVTFRFAVDRYGKWNVCVPYNDVDRHGKFKKQKELCYDSEQPH